MRARREELARRRVELVAQSAVQRAQLAYYYGRFEGPVTTAGRVAGFVHGLRRSPLAITGLAALLWKTPWRKLARVPRLAWRGWRILQFVRRWTK